MLTVFYDLSPLSAYPAGIPVYTLELMRALSRRSDVSLVSGIAAVRPSHHRRLDRVLGDLRERITFCRSVVPGAIARRAPGLPGHISIPRLPRVDLVHVTDVVPPSWPPLERFVLTIHDLGFLYGRRWSPLDAEHSRVFRDLARRASAFTAVSEFTRRDAASRLDIPPERIHVAPNGGQYATDGRLPPPDSSFLERRGLIESRYFLSVGVLGPRKNFGTLLDAFAEVRRREPDAELVLVGREGWLCDDVVARLRRPGTGVMWIPRCTGAELRALYRGARAMALVSWCEGFGLPVLEALQHGCPVCVSTGSALTEVAGDAGLHVPPGDAEAIAEALLRLWRDEALRGDLAGRAAARAKNFDWNRSAEATAAAYHHAVEG